MANRIVAAIIVLVALLATVTYVGIFVSLARRDERIHDAIGSTRIVDIRAKLERELPDTTVFNDRVISGGKFGAAYSRLHLDLEIEVLRPGAFLVHCIYLPASSGPREIERVARGDFAAGRRVLAFDMDARDFVEPLIWATPNPRWKGHPSWVEGWSGRVEVRIEQVVAIGDRESTTVVSLREERRIPGFRDVATKTSNLIGRVGGDSVGAR
jgi:hypothetical protein